ncbi:MAG TPA: DUF4019 domain-containing protein [Sphingomonadaceae bacterium]|nr:DUF4019 domain-containing protein [Sphingomonadaceae bacterium]
MYWLSTLLALATFGSGGSFTLSMSVRPDTREGQLLLAREAQRRCDLLFARLGRYRFEGNRALGETTPKPVKWKVRQEFTCGKALAEVPQPPAADPDWQPTPAIEQEIMNATARYFAWVDAADAPNAHAAWSAENQQMLPLAQRREVLTDERKAAGEPLGHRVLKLSWYINPADAPMPGIYVAADYEKRYRNLAAHCGYLVWFRQPDGRFVIVREEAGRLNRSDASAMSPSMLAEARAQLRCPAQ